MGHNIGSLEHVFLPASTVLKRGRNLIANLRTMTSIVLNWYRRENKFWAEKEAPITFKKGDLKLKIRKDVIELVFRNRRNFFHYDSAKQFINTLGLLNHQFIKEQYSWLNVKNREVVDIGASIGDSAIYFAAKGAKRVYAIEPFPYSYELAKKNIQLSGMGKKIRLLNIACKSNSKGLRINSKFQNFSGASVVHGTKGTKIKTITLEELADRYSLDDCILKIDCEGDEQDILLNAKENTLRKFRQMMIEYHYGYKNIEERLKRAGFQVRHTVPIRSYNPQAAKHEMILGLIYATRV